MDLIVLDLHSSQQIKKHQMQCIPNESHCATMRHLIVSHCDVRSIPFEEFAFLHPQRWVILLAEKLCLKCELQNSYDSCSFTHYMLMILICDIQFLHCNQIVQSNKKHSKMISSINNDCFRSNIIASTIVGKRISRCTEWKKQIDKHILRQ